MFALASTHIPDELDRMNGKRLQVSSHSSRRLSILVHHYFIISSFISSQDGNTTESCEEWTTREITEDSIDVN